MPPPSHRTDIGPLPITVGTSVHRDWAGPAPLNSPTISVQQGRPHVARKPGPPSLDDWLQAGYAILAERGAKALTILALCRRMCLKPDKFHRRFGNMTTCRAALAESWAELRDAERTQFARLHGRPPRQRLLQITSALISERHWTLERAMREWARSDATISASVRAADQRVVDEMRQAFLDAGFGPADADLRASTMFAAGLGFLHLSGSTPNRQATALREPFLDLLLRRGGREAPACPDKNRRGNVADCCPPDSHTFGHSLRPDNPRSYPQPLRPNLAGIVPSTPDR